MKQWKLLALAGVVMLLIVGLIIAPTTIVRAATGEAAPATNPTKLGSDAPNNNTLGFKYDSGDLAFGTYVNGVYTQIAWFSPSLIAQAPVTVTDSKTGYQISLSVSGGKTTVTIKDANGNVVATYVF